MVEENQEEETWGKWNVLEGIGSTVSWRERSGESERRIEGQ